jgi:hypothetical protein
VVFYVSFAKFASFCRLRLSELSGRLLVGVCGILGAGDGLKKEKMNKRR